MGTGTNIGSGSLSPDGRYLFLTSSVDRENDVFWIDAQVIEELRPPGN